MNKIIITRIDGKLVCVYMIGERIYDAVVEAEHEKDLRVGDIFLGRVQKVVDNIRAAFVELKPGIRGYLRLNEEQRKKVKTEQEILVQIKKPAKGDKDVEVSTDIELVGRYVLLQTGAKPEVRISAKIKEDKDVERLYNLAESWRIPKEETESGPVVTIRTNAVFAEEELLSAEFCKLYETWLDIHEHGKQRTMYSRLYREPPVYIRLINSFRTGQIDRIVTDREEIFQDLKEQLPGMNIERYDDPLYPMEARYAITTTLNKATERRVWLKSGANLIIDRTEAMTVIDVNTAKAVDVRRHFSM